VISGSCHDVMARPQVEDVGTAWQLQIHWIRRYRWPKSGGLPAWELSEVLLTPNNKKLPC